MVFDLIRFAEKNFWDMTIYDDFGTRVLEAYDKLGTIIVYTFIFIVNLATFNYVLAPFFGTILVFSFALTTAISQNSRIRKAMPRRIQDTLIYYNSIIK